MIDWKFGEATLMEDSLGELMELFHRHCVSFTSVNGLDGMEEDHLWWKPWVIVAKAYLIVV